MDRITGCDWLHGLDSAPWRRHIESRPSIESWNWYHSIAEYLALLLSMPHLPPPPLYGLSVLIHSHTRPSKNFLDSQWAVSIVGFVI